MEIQVLRKGNNLVVSSRVIAQELGKRHADVINQVDKIFNNENVRRSIIETSYEHKGNSYKEYLLTKDGFTLYMFNIQGYNDFKMAYINKFNEMEKQLQQLNIPSYEISDPIERAKRWIEEEEVRQLQAKQLEEQRPLVQFANKVAGSSDCIDIGTFAKLIKDEGIKMGRNKLFNWLRDNKYLMKDNTPYQQFIDREYFVVKEYTINTPYGDKIKTQTLLTGKGQIYFTEKLRGE